MKKLISICTVISMFLVANFSVICVNGSDVTKEIVIGYTNDIHGRYAFSESEDYSVGNVKSCIGLSKTKTVFDNEGADVILSAGDAFVGTGFAGVNEGENMAKAMKAVGYEYFAVGNHDWYYGKDRLVQNLATSEMTCLTGNVVTSDTGQPFFKNYDTKTIEGIKIGFFGVISPTIQISNTLMQGLTINDDIAHTKNMVSELKDKQKCDVIVAVIHHDDHEKYVSQISGVDLVIAGHLHTVYNKKVKDSTGKEIPVTESGLYLEDVGIAKIKVDANTKKVNDIDTKSISVKEVIGEGIPRDKQVAAIITEGTRIYNENSPYIAKDLTPLEWTWEDIRCKETEICRALADAVYESAHANNESVQIGLVTAGSLHGSVHRKLREKEVYDEILYGSLIEVKQLTGKNIKQMLETSLDIVSNNLVSNGTGGNWNRNSGDVIHISHRLKVTYDITQEKGSRIQRIQIDGDDLVDDRKYTVALTSHLGGLTGLYPELKEAVGCDGTYEDINSAFKKYLLANEYADTVKNARYMPINDINEDGIQDVVLKDDKTGVIVQANYGVLPENPVLSVEYIAKDSDKYKELLNSVDNHLKNAFNMAGLYDIKIYDRNDMETPITGFKPSQVTVKLPLAKDGSEVVRLESDDDTTFEESFETIDGIKYVVINTDHFSEYALMEEKQENSPSAMVVLMSVLSIISISAIIYTLVLKQKLKQNYK